MFYRVTSKRDRLFNSLSKRQAEDRCGNNVANFIQTAMNPVRYAREKGKFDYLRGELNKVLAFGGLILREDGKLAFTQVVSTISEAEKRADRLRAKLEDRNAHPDVLTFCRAELLQDNYFHAVLEATKSVADKIRKKSGLDKDGAELVSQAFGLGKDNNPILAFNNLSNETERDEQKGLVNLMIGMFGTFRNVTSHAPRITWPISEEDALDLLSLASYLHRRIDASHPI